MNDKIRAAFAEIHADDALVCSTAYYLHREMEKRRRNRFFPLTALAGVFAAAVMLILGIVGHSLYFTPDAYVSIDVNPSMELALNRFDKVIATRAFNGDGERVLSEVNLQGKRYDEAAGIIVSTIAADGYFAEDSLVSVTVQTANAAREQALCGVLREFIGEQVRSVGEAAEVEVFPVTAEVLRGAHGCNMSPAKYLAIQELLTVDEEATMEAYSDSSIGQIRRRTQQCQGDHGSGAEQSMHGNGNGHGHMGGR